MKLTQKDYDWCFKRMKYWQEKLGLKNQKLYLYIGCEGAFNRGESASDNINRYSNIRISTDYEFKDKQDVDLTIFHEICEAMFSDIDEKLEIGGFNDNIRQSLVHDIIRRLENLMFE